MSPEGATPSNPNGVTLEEIAAYCLEQQAGNLGEFEDQEAFVRDRMKTLGNAQD